MYIHTHRNITTIFPRGVRHRGLSRGGPLLLLVCELL